MLLHTAPVLHLMFYDLLDRIKRRNIYRPAKIVELLLSHFVFLLMGYWEKKQIFSSIVCVFLCDKWEKPFSIVMNWIRACLSFAILWATLLCVRESRTKWRCLGITDGASLIYHMTDWFNCIIDCFFFCFVSMYMFCCCNTLPLLYMCLYK